MVKLIKIDLPQDVKRAIFSHVLGLMGWSGHANGVDLE
jgi:hypothetical protein